MLLSDVFTFPSSSTAQTLLVTSTSQLPSTFLFPSLLSGHSPVPSNSDANTVPSNINLAVRTNIADPNANSAKTKGRSGALIHFRLPQSHYTSILQRHGLRNSQQPIFIDGQAILGRYSWTELEDVKKVLAELEEMVLKELDGLEEGAKVVWDDISSLVWSLGSGSVLFSANDHDGMEELEVVRFFRSLSQTLHQRNISIILCLDYPSASFETRGEREDRKIFECLKGFSHWWLDIKSIQSSQAKAELSIRAGFLFPPEKEQEIRQFFGSKALLVEVRESGMRIEYKGGKDYL
ncbi:hypothetical protein BT69DRAFT_1286780 [Atractiella rhizophila]|nr:hypothetical protein BT69DRAFT_1286780 [Atractiella rhizophila]